MRNRIMCATALAVAFVTSAAHARAAHAQADLFVPEVRYFRTPIADPMATRISVGLLSTNLLTTQGPEREPFTLPDPEDAARDVVAAVSIGVVMPLLHVAQWDGGGATLIMDGKVFSRFRIEYPSRDDMGQDWYVGGGMEARRHQWSGRAAIIHRSSHIGDEFAASTGAQRIEFGSEQLDLTAAYDVPGMLRVYGGGSWIFRSYLDWEPQLRALGIEDRALLQVGADREWAPWTDKRFAAYAGVDVQAAQRTEWEPQFAVAAGMGVRSQRSLRLMLRYFTGKSTMGEFFLTRERYFTLELVGEI